MTRMKLMMGGIAIAALAMVGSIAYATDVIPTCAAVSLPDPSNDNKATLCHFTGSASNPYVINEVSKSAAESHFGHHGDCVRADGTTVCF